MKRKAFATLSSAQGASNELETQSKFTFDSEVEKVDNIYNKSATNFYKMKHKKNQNDNKKRKKMFDFSPIKDYRKSEMN